MEIPDYLVNAEYNDRYFDVVNALDEARQIYFEYNTLEKRIREANTSGRPFRICETGFGAGRIVVALLEYLAEHRLENVSIDYYSVELHPMTPERMADVLSSFEERAGDYIRAVLDAYAVIRPEVQGWQEVPVQCGNGSITLHLWLGEALEMVDALPVSADVWFLDGHSPKKNPEIWRPELMEAVGRKTLQGGTCASFSVSGDVKRALAASGFEVRKMPGFGGKKVVLNALRL